MLRTPDTFQEAISLCQSVDAVVALSSRPHKSTESIGLVLAGVSTVLIDLADRDLYGGVVLGFDDSVGCTAFSGDVAKTKALV